MTIYLAESFWGTYPAWGTFIIGVATFIILIINSLRKKINHVEGVVDKLKEQNEILMLDHELNKKRFERETKIPLSDIRPVFKKDNQIPIQSNSIQLILINEGTKAQEIKLENASPEGATWHAALQTAETVISKGERLAITIYSGNPDFEGIKFEIIYYGEDDIKHAQSIAKKYGGNFHIETPA